MFKNLLIVFLVFSFKLNAEIVITPINSITEIPSERPSVGHYRLHLIDVGTGLSILIQGNSWDLLYDAGSADDKAGNQATGDSKSRVIAYLYKAIAPSGSVNCKPAEDGWSNQGELKQVPIKHVFLSHPHEDHGSMLDDVLDCFDALNIYDTGRVNHALFYQRFIERVAKEKGTTYRTAKLPPATKLINIRGNNIDLSSIVWKRFNEIEEIVLDQSASFRILHANASTKESDPNSNSIVLKLTLGSKSVLLTGDAESGSRKLPFNEIEGLEKKLVDKHSSSLKADILQIGHHGSLTSTRSSFLSAVNPAIALVSAGPKKYKSVILPDREIIELLQFRGIHILRTDSFDTTQCPSSNKVGRDDKRPGGCANFLLEW